jgi:hypothetical protein
VIECEKRLVEESLSLADLAGGIACDTIVRASFLALAGFPGLAAAQTTDFEAAMQAFERQGAKYPPPPTPSS